MLKSLKKIFSHIVIIILSASAALSIPYIGRFIANNYQRYWSLIENKEIFLISMEISVAALLIFLFNLAGRSLKNMRLSGMAAKAGMVLVTNTQHGKNRKNPIAGNSIKKLILARIRKFKEKEGFSKDILLIGSTGYSTFVDPDGDFHNVLKNCREAKIMLLNPFCEGAALRARGIPEPDITPESFKSRILQSIDFLTALNEVHQNIRLKLFSDSPFLKLAILGDYISMRPYRAGLGTREMPEYIFRHSQDTGSLFDIFYQFFLSRWRDPGTPEYDFNTRELIYRDGAGGELRRERLE
ncbi:MAG: hypothetical protein M0Z75_00860 [Nitrospiraceae bacterium]|nr:hypothetical protein [Nitrospiraceae bacterium]MDA8089687.1 hypothetical protein [Nitrospiraceae bacterium]